MTKDEFLAKYDNYETDDLAEAQLELESIGLTDFAAVVVKVDEKYCLMLRSAYERINGMFDGISAV